MQCAGSQIEGWGAIPLNNGAFRSRESDKFFFVDVSDQLNTPSFVFAGRLVVCIGLAINEQAEFIAQRLGQDSRVLEAEVAAADARFQR